MTYKIISKQGDIMSEKEQSINLPIEWNYPENIVSKYATNLVVQHTEHEFILSFFEARPPVILGSIDKEKALQLKSIKAECVARVFISAGRMSDFVKVLQDNLNIYKAKSNQLE